MSALRSMLQRRGALVGGVFLLLCAAWFVVWAGSGSGARYVAEARLAVRDPRPVLSSEELAPYLPKDSPANSYFTREGLLTAAGVFRDAAVLVETFRDAETPPTAGDWTRLADSPIRVGAYDKETHGGTWIELEDSIEVGVEDDGSGLIRIRAFSSREDEAKLMANAFAWSARRAAAVRAEELMASIGGAIQVRLKKMRDDVAFRELDLGAVEQESLGRERRMGALNASMADLGRRIDDTLTRKDRLSIRVEALEAAEHRRREALPVGPEEDGLTSAVLKRLRADMDAIRISIAQEGLAKTPQAPRYKDFMRRLAQFETAYRSELDRVRGRELLRLRESMTALDAELRLLDERRMRKALEIQELTDDAFDRRPVEDRLDRMRAELARAEEVGRRFDAALQAGQGYHVVFGAAATDSSVPMERSRWPIWPGVLAAIALAFAAGFLAERGDARIRTDADIKRALNLPGLAVVEEAPDPVILRLHPQDALAETFAMAGTMLRSYLSEREFKSVVVTSAAAQEGKSTVAANLAVALARKGLDVVLVDTDLRRPRIHDIFNMDGSKGLSTLLSGEEEDAEAVLGATEIPSLRVLPSGPTPEVPGDLLESPRMAELHQTLREKFDVVVFDAPPVTEVGDGLALSRLADTNVWVVRSGQSDARELGWARHLLGNVRADVAGVVLTFATRRGGERFYAYPVASSRV